MESNKIKKIISDGKVSLGIEFGSTRIKAVLISQDGSILAVGKYDWENKLENGYWTYSLEDIFKGLQECYSNLAQDVKVKYGEDLVNIASVGISGMMHGYMPFDKEGNLLVPFRTWRNTTTQVASEELTKKFEFHIPQRWSIAHLYQAFLNNEEHMSKISHLTTLAGFIHWKLTGEKVMGIGEASGMFPIDSEKKNYNADMMDKFNKLIAGKNTGWKIEDILPQVKLAGGIGGTLSEEGAKLLDPTGTLKSGSLMCPPEGDAGTGMVATNSTAKRTGNVSAGTSVFLTLVLENELKELHEEIDLATTPAGDPVAMVHCNNCTSDLNAWVGLLKETLESFSVKVSTDDLYRTLYLKALEGDIDCGGLLAYNYLSGEHITGFEAGRPLFVRTPESNFSLGNFMRVHLYTSLGALKTGMDILTVKEKVGIDRIYGHGGFFKIKEVGPGVMASALNTPVSILETADEGGAWGMAVLAALPLRNREISLDEYLKNEIFKDNKETTVVPEPKDVEGFMKFHERYINGLEIERAAVNNL